MTPGGPVGLLAVHEELPSNFFELLEEHAEDLDEVPELPKGQIELPFTPEAQNTAGCVWSAVLEAYPNSRVWFSHDVFAFLPKLSSAKPKAEGGGPVKAYLTTRQKCLFPTAWFRRSGG